MSELTTKEFGDYFKAIHGGKEPFPWQQRLLERVARERRWPELLDLPTGSGKTATLDIALFHLAMESGRADRAAPMRIVLVVDRRTIVDQAHQRAMDIQKALRDGAPGTVLACVRERLCAGVRSEGRAAPLWVALLRGGIARDEGWAKAPDQPLIAVSTVDQVGSRLLFRGYGVSPGMRPIHAGLLGNDALLLLDEVHLSEPFAETLDAIHRYYRRAPKVLPERWQVVRMSATARDPASSEPFGLDAQDRTHPVLRPRLEASKLVQLQEVKVGGGDDAREQAFAAAIAQRAAEVSLAEGSVTGVVVNRVARARRVFEALHAKDKADVQLITGRMRPLDRTDLEEEVGPRIRAGRTRTREGRPLIVVATQCIEAGADYDFDSLITECASLDALRQRFGRLNRLGDPKLPVAQGWIMMRSDAIEEADPVYGSALAETWKYLTSQEQPIDFGISGLEVPKDVGPLLPERLHAPVLLPSHLDAWAQTSPAPEPDPEVALWLHGPKRGTAEVKLIWRADVDQTALQDDLQSVLERLEACPPCSGEALSVPIYAARAWLASGAGAGDMADVEGGEAPEEERTDDAGRPALAWMGAESRLVFATGLSPEMTLVVPATYGGLAQHTWDPSSLDAVTDLGDRAMRLQRGRAVLRLDPRVLGDQAGTVPIPEEEDAEDRDDVARVRPWLEEMSTRADAPGWLTASAKDLLRDLTAKRRPCRVLPIPGARERNSGDLCAGGTEAGR